MIVGSLVACLAGSEQAFRATGETSQAGLRCRRELDMFTECIRLSQMLWGHWLLVMQAVSATSCHGQLENTLRKHLKQAYSISMSCWTRL